MFKSKFRTPNLSLRESNMKTPNQSPISKNCLWHKAIVSIHPHTNATMPTIIRILHLLHNKMQVVWNLKEEMLIIPMIDGKENVRIIVLPNIIKGVRSIIAHFHLNRSIYKVCLNSLYKEIMIYTRVFFISIIHKYKLIRCSCWWCLNKGFVRKSLLVKIAHANEYLCGLASLAYIHKNTYIIHSSFQIKSQQFITRPKICITQLYSYFKSYKEW